MGWGISRLAAVGTAAVLTCASNLVFSATLTTVSAASNSRGALLGVISGDSGLYRIDQSRGVPTQVASITDGGYLQDLAADPRSPTLYESELVCLIPAPKGCGESVEEVSAIDTNSGSASVASATRFLQSIVFDQIDHSLYGLAIADCCPFSTAVVRVNPSTGFATVLATFGGHPYTIAVDPPAHTLYVDLPNTATNPYTGQLAAIDLRTGAVAMRPAVRTALVDMAFDSRSHKLFALTWDSPSRFVRVDTRTGETTLVGSFATGFGVPLDLTIDPVTHTAFVLQSEVHGDFTAINRIVSLDDRTGVGTMGAPFPGLFDSIAFQTNAPS